MGRAAARDQKNEREAVERSINAGVSKGKRGMSVLERVQLATLELNVGRFDKENTENEILTLKFEVDMLEKKIDRAMQRAQLSGDFTKVDALEQELDEVRLRLSSFRDKRSIGIKRCRDLLSAHNDESKEKESEVAQNS